VIRKGEALVAAWIGSDDGSTHGNTLDSSMADLSTPMSIRVAATLSLVEHAGSAGATAEQLASDTGTATLALRCLLDHLVTIGLFDLDLESSLY
jgi:hypothetical protein